VLLVYNSTIVDDHYEPSDAETISSDSSSDTENDGYVSGFVVFGSSFHLGNRGYYVLKTKIIQ
jgi:hypothetical protein